VIKRPWGHGVFKQIYVTIPDLHLRKSIMHSILTQIENSGVRHLATLNANQWDYLKNVCSIHKAFEFMERLSESLRIALSYEFLTYLFNKEQTNISNITAYDPHELHTKFEQFIVINSVDKIFRKNVQLLELTEAMLMHQTAERSRNWDLRTSVLKDLLDYAMISNCTQYGPLLIELLFHQLSFQKRYISILKDGFFTFNLRNDIKSAFVGNDAVIEDVNLLAGQFRHKRQTLDQAIQQSNCIQILLLKLFHQIFELNAKPNK